MANQIKGYIKVSPGGLGSYDIPVSRIAVSQALRAKVEGEKYPLDSNYFITDLDAECPTFDTDFDDNLDKLEDAAKEDKSTLTAIFETITAVSNVTNTVSISVVPSPAAEISYRQTGDSKVCQFSGHIEEKKDETSNNRDFDAILFHTSAVTKADVAYSTSALLTVLPNDTVSIDSTTFTVTKVDYDMAGENFDMTLRGRVIEE